jgi:hypothetical protein
VTDEEFVAEYCEARTAAQMTAASWGAANQGCGRKAVAQGEDGGWYCRQHLDPKKRYGRNRRNPYNRKGVQ